jgi:hypothetical protein
MINLLRKHLPLKFKHYVHVIEKCIQFEHLKSLRFINFDQIEIEAFYKKLQPFQSGFPLKRVGGNGDGGYLIPDLEIQWDAIISPGVGGSIAFESEVANQDTAVFLIDATVKPPRDLPRNFHFISKMLRSGNDDSDSTNLQELINDSRIKGKNLLLQMDIEGGEWEILLDASAELLEKFMMIVVELHNLEYLKERQRFVGLNLALDKLLKYHFVTHVHANNAGSFYFHRFKRYPKVVEVTLVRETAFKRGNLSEIPHELDRPSDQQIYNWQFSV